MCFSKEIFMDSRAARFVAPGLTTIAYAHLVTSRARTCTQPSPNISEFELSDDDE